MTLEEAQIAKVDLSLGKLGLQPGQTLLDIGCGWGTTIVRALERYDVNVVGLTLSRNQQAHVQQRSTNTPAREASGCCCRAGSSSTNSVDRIVSIGAFEHFGRDRYTDFFKMAYEALPADGVMMLHTIIQPSAMSSPSAGCPSP